jgi:hypothetical protein
MNGMCGIDGWCDLSPFQSLGGAALAPGYRMTPLWGFHNQILTQTASETTSGAKV